MNKFIQINLFLIFIFGFLGLIYGFFIETNHKYNPITHIFVGLFIGSIFNLINEIVLKKYIKNNFFKIVTTILYVFLFIVLIESNDGWNIDKEQYSDIFYDFMGFIIAKFLLLCFIKITNISIK